MDKLQFLVLIFPVLLSKLCNVSLCNFIKHIKAVFFDSLDGGDLSIILSKITDLNFTSRAGAH